MTSSIRYAVDITLKLSLFIALICSLFILLQYFIFDNKEYKCPFMAWQGPMIAALLMELYLIR